MISHLYTLWNDQHSKPEKKISTQSQLHDLQGSSVKGKHVVLVQKTSKKTDIKGTKYRVFPFFLSLSQPVMAF